MRGDALQELLKRRDSLREKLKEIQEVIDEVMSSMNNDETLVHYQTVINNKEFIELKIKELDERITLLQDNIKLQMTVIVEIEGRKKEFTVVEPRLADSTMGLISNSSPLAVAIKGRKIGEIFNFVTPAGIRECRLVSVN